MHFILLGLAKVLCTVSHHFVLKLKQSPEGQKASNESVSLRAMKI